MTAVRKDLVAGTPLFMSRAEVERLLTPQRCIDAVENAFRQLALGRAPVPGILAMHAADGSFHVKAGLLAADRVYYAAKVNANFPGNSARGLPTIQGVVVLFDATNGTPLAILDSAAITALRTAAASALAARHLALEDCGTATICGCGGQAREQLRALLAVRRVRVIHAYDRDAARAQHFAHSMAQELGLDVRPASALEPAVAESAIVITCTTATRFFITRAMVRPGTFIAAVGADHEHKQEIDPELMRAATVVTDVTQQAGSIGDLHHAIEAGVMRAEDVHAELGDIVAGLKPGRRSRDEIIVFDSTGTGLQDVAAAIAVYHRALERDPS